MKLGLGLGFSHKFSASSNFLDSVSNLIEFEIDASQSDSYSGSGQTINNLVTSSSGGTYSFFRGVGDTADENDPIWDGENFVFNGSQRIVLDGNTAFINRMHKTDETDLEYTYSIEFYWPANITTGSYTLFGTTNSSGDNGIRLEYDRDNTQFELRQSNGSYQNTNVLTSITLTEGWHTLQLGVQKTSGTAGNYRVKLDDNSASTGSLTAFGATTTDAGDDFQISGVSGSQQMPAGSKFVRMALFNDYLSDAEMTSLKSLWDVRGGAVNPISSLDNVISDIDLSNYSAYTFSSGVVIDAIAAVSGLGLEQGGAPEFDYSAFSGSGGARMKTTAQYLYQNANFTPSTTQTVFFVVELPSYVSNVSIFSYASGTGAGNANARVLHNAVGGMSYGRNEAASFETILSGASDNAPYVVCLRVNSASDLDYFINSTTESGSFDPDDNITTLNRIRLGTRTSTDGDDEIAFGYLLHTSDAMSDSEIADVMTYLADKFGVSL